MGRGCTSSFRELVENFNWDDLVINTSQLTTEEWTPEKLIKLVQREQLKTKLSVYLSDKAGRIYLLKKIIVLKQMGKILFFYQMRLIHILVYTYVNLTMVKRKEREDTKTAN